MKERKFLTSSEAKVMRILWSHFSNGAYTSEILKHYEDPKPAYTTLATFLKILTRKGFVKPKKTGAMLFFRPVVAREDYVRELTVYICEGYFEGDAEKMKQFVNEVI